MTNDELLKYVYDPTVIQHDMLDFISKATDGDLNVTSATNPFVMLMEAAAVTASNSAIESRSVIRSKYPSLATQTHELYQHLSDEELINIFGVPSIGNIVFYVSVNNLKQYGYRDNVNKYVTTVVPMYTEVIVSGTTFTMLNDVNVRLYDDGTVFVEHVNNDLDISVKDIGILKSGIITDSEGIQWIVFEIYLKQIKRTSVSKSIVTIEGFKKQLPTTDSYYHTDVYYVNKYTGSSGKRLEKKHNEEFINENVPSIYVSVNADSVLYRIPDIYLLSNAVTGNVTIDMYETKGKIYLPLNKLGFNDFTIVMGNTTSSPQAASVTNITVLATSRDVVNGGSDAMTTDELRKSIVFNTTGINNLPITEFDIESRATEYGYELFKAVDIITERVFIAAKNAPEVESKLLHSKADIFFNTVELLLSNINSSSIERYHDDVIIRSNTVFKEVNGKVRIVTDDELADIDRMDVNKKIFHYNSNKYFFTPYYYILDTEIDRTSSRVYDLDRAEMSDLKIIAKNVNIKYKVNTDKYIMIKTPTGYRVVISLLANKEFGNILPSLIKGELKFKVGSTEVYVSYPGVYDAKSGYIEFDIDTNHYVDNDNNLIVQNGISNVSNKIINLVSEAEIYIYTIDGNVQDPSGYLKSNISTFNDINKITVFTKETAKITFGKEVKYIWNKLFNAYTERKYKKYTENVYAKHEEDVYKINPDTGNSVFLIEDEDGKKHVSRTLLYKSGDDVLDHNGERVVKYRKGDIIPNPANGLPMIDNESGVVRYLDIMMLEYEYKVATSLVYETYLTTVLDMLDSVLFKDMILLNDNLIENTAMVYKSFKSAGTVTIKSNNVLSSIPYVTRPKIKLYINGDTVVDTVTVDKLKTTIGKIIHNSLDKVKITLSEIKKEIITKAGIPILAVKVEGIDVVNNNEAFMIDDKSKRLIVDKQLELNKNKELVVKYNIDLTVQIL